MTSGHRRALIQPIKPAIPGVTCWSISTPTTSFLMVKRVKFTDTSHMWGWREVPGIQVRWKSGVGVMEQNFMKMGGYDESFEATGYQDMDVFERFKACGSGSAYYLRDFSHGCSIPNSTDVKKAKSGVKTQFTASPLKWHDQNEKKSNCFEGETAAGEMVPELRRQVS